MQRKTLRRTSGILLIAALCLTGMPASAAPVETDPTAVATAWLAGVWQWLGELLEAGPLWHGGTGTAVSDETGDEGEDSSGYGYIDRGAALDPNGRF